MNKLFEQINKIRFAVTGNPLSEKDIITYQKKMTEDGYSPLPQEISRCTALGRDAISWAAS